MDIFGAHIPDLIRDTIQDVEVVVCDITRPNLNVYYEAGYAIGIGKTLAPVVNRSFASAIEEISERRLVR